MLFRSRGYKEKVSPENCAKRREGSICISNERYLRYEGELEIVRRDLPEDERVNVVGRIVPDDLKYIPFIQKEMGVRICIGK